MNDCTTKGPRALTPERRKPLGMRMTPKQRPTGMDYFLCVIGMVMVVEGVPYFAAPDRMKAWMARIMELAPETLRRFGLAMMLVGLLLVYIGRR